MSEEITYEFEVYPGGEHAQFDFWYPRLEGMVKYLGVGLLDVRAADSLRIHYDFDRDGYVIEQSSIWSWPADDTEMDVDWQEVAFIQAWARDKRPRPRSER